MTDWDALTQSTLRQLEHVDARYRPTNFWGPGLQQLLADMDSQGLENFKSWPTASFWFYPRYAPGATPELVSEAAAAARAVNPRYSETGVQSMLSGYHLARRDFDAARLAWDHARWPLRLSKFGERSLGNRPEVFHLTRRQHGWTRPYLNYMLCMAALSQVVDRPPSSFLELGGGYGVLGEFLLTRGERMRYVNLDIPPLVTVSSYYLRTLFGDRVAVADDVPESGRVTLPQSGVLPNWRLPDVDGPFDVFVNSYSFQEMEPEVVRQYIDQVVSKDVEYVVSLNSRRGKPRLDDGHAIGVQDQVTSAYIAAQFAERGYTLLRRHNSPLVNTAGELIVLQRTDRLPRRIVLSRAAGRVRRVRR